MNEYENLKNALDDLFMEICHILKLDKFVIWFNDILLIILKKQGVCMTLYESHMNFRDEETAKARRMRNKTNREIHASKANRWENNCREMTIEQAEKELRK